VKLAGHILRKAMLPISLSAQEFYSDYCQDFHTSQSRRYSDSRDHQSPRDFPARWWEGAEPLDLHLPYNAKKDGQEHHFLEPSNGEAHQHHSSSFASNES
jgi:hypothetical protein